MLNQFGPAGLLVLGLCLPWAYVGKPETARSVWAVVDLVGEGRDTGFEQTAVGLAIGLVILAVFVALFQPFFSNGRARLVPIGTGIAAALMTLVSMIAMGEAGLVSSGEGSTGSLGAAAFFVLLFAAGWLVLAPRDHH